MIRTVFGFSIATVALLICSCATQRVVTQVPSDAAMHQWTQPGDLAVITVNTEDGEPLPFVVDTGCPRSWVDTSLAASFGKPIGTMKSRWAFYGTTNVNVYRTPKLYLGKTQLEMPDEIGATEIQNHFGGRAIKGVLGIDCLKHYCVQFDFIGGKLRFLDPTHLDRSTLGKAFPLKTSFGAVSTRLDVMGLKNVSLRTDTGLFGGADMALKDGLYKQGMRQQKLVPAKDAKSGTNVFIASLSHGTNTITNIIRTGSGLSTARKKCDAAWFSNTLVGGELYTNVVFVSGAGQTWPADNWLGMRFLARHEVTFDFPNRTMYLRPVAATIGATVPAEQTASR